MDRGFEGSGVLLASDDIDIDINTLSRQMGTSVAMLERHYSKLTATMAGKRLVEVSCSPISHVSG
jgi:hypothetical protein